MSSSVKKSASVGAAPSDEAPRRAKVRVKRPAWKHGRLVFRGPAKTRPPPAATAAAAVQGVEQAEPSDAEDSRPRRRLAAPLRRRPLPGNPMSAMARARARRYTTRSEAPPQMLRNGKKIRFRETEGGAAAGQRQRRSGDWTPATPNAADWDTPAASVKTELSSPPCSPLPNGDSASTSGSVTGSVTGPVTGSVTGSVTGPGKPRRSELELLLNSDPVPPPLALPVHAPASVGAADDEPLDGGSPRTDSNCNLFAVKGKRGGVKTKTEDDVDADWEAGSTVSTPSSRNADAEEDGLSTDCEGRDVRRSRRSTIRKSRAALLRLATGRRQGGDEEEPVGVVVVVKTEPVAPPPVVAVPVAVEEPIKAPPEPNDPRAEAKRLSDDAKRRRIKSLSTQDIVSLVDKGLFPGKARRASDFGSLKLTATATGAGFTLPASTKGKLKLVAASIRKGAPLKLENGPGLASTVASESCKVPTEMSADVGHELIGEATEPPVADEPTPDAVQTEAAVSEGVTQVGDLDKEGVAEKLREISMRFEADIDMDILPSLNIKDLGKDLGKDIKDLGKDIKDLKDITDLGKDIKDLGKDLGKDIKDIKDLGKDLGKDIKDISDLGKDITDLGKDISDLGKGIKDLKDIKAAVDEVETKPIVTAIVGPLPTAEMTPEKAAASETKSAEKSVEGPPEKISEKKVVEIILGKVAEKKVVVDAPLVKIAEKKAVVETLEQVAERRAVEKSTENVAEEKPAAAQKPIDKTADKIVPGEKAEKVPRKTGEQPHEKDAVDDKPAEAAAPAKDADKPEPIETKPAPAAVNKTPTQAKPEPNPAETPTQKAETPADAAKPHVPAPYPEAPKPEEEDSLTAAQRAAKESVLGALGLQSLEAAARARRAGPAAAAARPAVPGYTGTLKAVIKLQRSPEKRTRTSKMKLNVGGEKKAKRDKEAQLNGYQYSICKETLPADENVPGGGAVGLPLGNGNHITSNPTLFAERAPSTEDADAADSADGPTEGETGEKAKQSLVIPEKASSFSIHPGRLCSDVCSYCFGKFGSLDTPCHIAQLRGSDKQVNILQAELHLTAESCLCDACYRHVDRKANCPAYREKAAGKESLNLARNRPTTACCVQGCQQPAEHHVRRKWLNKLKRSIAKKVPVSSNKLSQHTALPLCAQHFAWVDLYMACGICRRRLTCNQMYPLGPEVGQVNEQLEAERVPAHLTEKVFLCKLCRYFSQLIVKHPDRTRLSGSNKMFYESYRKKIFHGLDMEAPADPPPTGPPAKRRKKPAPPALLPLSVEDESPAGSPPPLDLGDMLETQLTEDAEETAKPRAAIDKQRPPPDELAVTAHADFTTARTVRCDSEGVWERCNFTLQYDVESRAAFERLRRPYGSQSAFFKHLLTLEQYWRAGELVPAQAAHSRTKSYLKSVAARVTSFQAAAAPPSDPGRRRASETAAPPPATATALLSPGSSANPLFVSQGGAAKFSVNPATGELLAAKRKPNIVQVTKGGQPLFRLVDPTKSQIRALQGYKRKAPSTTTTTASNPPSATLSHGPMICDVRSLAAESWPSKPAEVWPLKPAEVWPSKPAEVWPAKVAIPSAARAAKRAKEVTILPKGKGGLPLALSNSLEVSVSPIYPKDSGNR